MSDSLIPPKALEKLAKRYGLGEYECNVSRSSPVLESFSIEELDDRFTFGPVSYRGDRYNVSWSKELLDGGASRAQEDWVNWLDSEWLLAGGSLQFAMLHALYEERDGAQRDLVNKILEMVRPDYKVKPGSRAVTGTRIIYGPNGDKVIHEYGSVQEYEIPATIVGPNGIVELGRGFDDALEALLGTGDIPLINKVLRWVHPLNPSLWRANEIFQREFQTVLVLGIEVAGRFSVNADDSLDRYRPARGVAIEKITGGNP